MKSFGDYIKEAPMETFVAYEFKGMPSVIKWAKENNLRSGGDSSNVSYHQDKDLWAVFLPEKNIFYVKKGITAPNGFKKSNKPPTRF